MKLISSQRVAFAAACLFVCSLFATAAVAAGGPAGEGRGPGAKFVKPTLLADLEVVAPGGTFTLGVRMKIEPHWHTYWINPGEAGDATKVSLSGPAGFEFGQIQWPVPSKIDAPGGITYGYEDEVLLLIPVTVGADVPTGGGDVTIEADVSWLVCKEECIKGGAELSISLPVSAAPKPANRELFDAWRKRLPVPQDDARSSAVLAKAEQPAGAGGAPEPALSVQWKDAPRKVEWFPVSTRAVVIDNVVVRHEGQQTRIEFKPTVYKPDQVPGGKVDGVLVYEDAAGQRHGIEVPVRVSTSK